MPQVFEQSRSCFQRTLLFRRGEKDRSCSPLLHPRDLAQLFLPASVSHSSKKNLPPKKCTFESDLMTGHVENTFFLSGTFFGCQSKCWIQVRPDFFGTSSSRTLGHLRLPTKWTKMKFPFCWMYKRGDPFSQLRDLWWLLWPYTDGTGGERPSDMI